MGGDRPGVCSDCRGPTSRQRAIRCQTCAARAREGWQPTPEVAAKTRAAHAAVYAHKRAMVPEVLRLVREGRRFTEVALATGLHVSTVRDYWQAHGDGVRRRV